VGYLLLNVTKSLLAHLVYSVCEALRSLVTGFNTKDETL
jgi:hypothetical protein